MISVLPLMLAIAFFMIEPFDWRVLLDLDGPVL